MPLLSPKVLTDLQAMHDGLLQRENQDCRSLSATHIGRVRRLNEDDLYASDEHRLWLVADGMGGHTLGDVASRTIVENVQSFAPLGTLSESISDLETRFLLANKSCRGLLGDKVVGSTLAALLVFESLAIFIWAGDSRVYRYRDGDLKLLTEDHNLAQERCRRGELSQYETQQLPEANVLTRAVGIHQNLVVEIGAEPTQKDDIYLLCTDGLYRDLTTEDISSVFESHELEQTISTLIDMALEKGGKDNITACAVRIHS